MTTMYGADVAQLRQAAAQFDRHAQQLDADRMTVGNAIKISAWVGPFATSFRVQWDSEHSRRVHDAATRLRDAAQKLRGNADEQEHASAASGGSTGRRLTGGDRDGAVGGHGPKTTADIYAGIHGMKAGEDGVRIQIILGDDGQERMIVYINGTKSAADGSGLFTWGSNAELMAGADNKTLKHVRQMIADAVKQYPNAEIMLAGYSQGGIVAQRIAQEDRFNISAVVTYGSPRLPVSGLGSIDVVRLEHRGDIVPGLDGEGLLPGDVDMINAANARRDGGVDVVYRGGNPLQFTDGNPHTDQADYKWLADQFDNSDRADDIAGRNALRRFQGTVVDGTL